jgi:hypothetical protein
MAVLDLRGIICDKTQEAVDEPYLEVYVDRGEHSSDRWSWGPVSMNDGDARSINWARIFHERIRVELWEHNRIGADSHIGDLSLTATETWGSETTQYLRGHGAEYRLIYALNPRRDHRFILNLVSLHCNDAQEATDEPYLVVNGSTVWGPSSMETGQTRTMEGVGPIYFSGGGTAIVELWERDAARSNRIGPALRLTERLARIFAEDPRENRSYHFHGDYRIAGDATYTLTYRVSRE